MTSIDENALETRILSEKVSLLSDCYIGRKPYESIASPALVFVLELMDGLLLLSLIHI